MAKTAAIAALRPDYQAELADGTDRFHLPERTTCPWCASSRLRRHVRTTDLVQGKPGTFVLDQCRDCGHVFQNPRLNQEGLDFYYRDFYDGLGAEAAAKMFQGSGSRKRFRASARSMVPHCRPRRWLDVGSSHGHFCVTAKEELPDTEFDGLDRSESVDLAAKEGRVATAYRGLFVDLADDIAARYDVVSMFHYLEHTLDPKAELAAAQKALRPGGHLLIEVPDPQSLMGKLLGRWWMPWFQPQHLQLMPLANVRAELTRRGFTVVVAERKEAHIPADLVCGTWFMINRMLPPDDAPWLAQAPGRLSVLTRWAVAIAAIPLLLLAYGLDLALAPLVRRSRLSNAFRVIARRDG